MILLGIKKISKIIVENYYKSVLTEIRMENFSDAEFFNLIFRFSVPINVVLYIKCVHFSLSNLKIDVQNHISDNTAL